MTEIYISMQVQLSEGLKPLHKWPFKSRFSKKLIAEVTLITVQRCKDFASKVFYWKERKEEKGGK